MSTQAHRQVVPNYNIYGGKSKQQKARFIWHRKPQIVVGGLASPTIFRSVVFVLNVTEKKFFLAKNAPETSSVDL